MTNKTKGRIEIPSHPSDQLDLAAAILKKHLELGDASPLKNIEDIDWGRIGPLVKPTAEAQAAAEVLRLEMNKQYGIRDKHLPEIQETMRATAQLLKAVYRKNPKMLGDWGIVVFDTPPEKENGKK